jgi:hypothetical protein
MVLRLYIATWDAKLTWKITNNTSSDFCVAYVKRKLCVLL